MERKKEYRDEDIWSLVHKIKQGDREAFMTLTRMYQKKVFVLTYSFFRNKEDALDLVQETFLRLYQRIETFEHGRNFEGWMLQIAKNLCIDYYRKHHLRRREFESGKTAEELDVPDARADETHAASDFKQILTRCVDRLAERQRTIFIMRHYNQMKNEEIAQVLNISLGTVKSLHFKAIQNLRALMSPYLGCAG